VATSSVEVVPYLVDVGTDGLQLAEGQLLVVRRRVEEGEEAAVLLAAIARSEAVAETHAEVVVAAPAVGDTFALLVRRVGLPAAAFAVGTVREVEPLDGERHEVVFGFAVEEGEALRAALGFQG
jgi:hypothetical protein